VSCLNKQPLEHAIEKTIEEYNKYRTPEVVARLVSLDSSGFNIEFKGHFCHTCGFYDYFDDFRFLLEDINLKTEIKEIEEIDEGAVVTFTIEA
jgi:hypothetical protein